MLSQKDVKLISKKTPRFTIQIVPPDSIIQYVRDLSKSCMELIDRKEEMRSQAHISLFNFVGRAATSASWLQHLDQHIKTLQPITLCFNELRIFSNGAVVILPVGASFDAIISLVRKLTADKPAPLFAKTKYPHITIARNLSIEDHPKLQEFVTLPITLTFPLQNIRVLEYDVTDKIYRALANFHIL